MVHGVRMEVRRQCAGASPLLPPCGAQGVNLGYQAWWCLYPLSHLSDPKEDLKSPPPFTFIVFIQCDCFLNKTLKLYMGTQL